MARTAEQQLALLLNRRAEAPRFNGEYAATAERLFAELVGGQLERPSRHSRGSSPDILITPFGDTPIAIELKLLNTASFQKTVRNRVSELLAAAVETRRSFRDEATLVAVFLLADAQGTGHIRDDKIFSRTAEGLLRAEDGVGYDSVLFGTAGDELQWRYFASIKDTESANSAGWLATAEAVSLIRRQKAAPQLSPPKIDPANPRRIMLVADEWRSSQGGLSTVNRELATALATAGVETAIFVPHATDDDIRSASDADVALVTPARIPGLSDRESLLLRPVFADSTWKPDVIVGHGRVLGAYAAAQKQQFFPQARRVHFVHTDAEQLEAAKEAPGGASRMVSADARRSLERDLAGSADLVVGVGPLLTATIADDLIGAGAQPKVACLVPGLRSTSGSTPLDSPVKNNVLIVGRADDFRSKGIDIAAEAMLKVVNGWPAANPHPPVLVLRGVPNDAATTVKARLDEIVERRENLYRLRPYSDSEDMVTRDLRQARLLLMPSRHEGFGLAAYEAIASCVPVLISAESGLAQFLAESKIDTVPSSIVSTRDTAMRLAIDNWTDAISYVLNNPEAARGEARKLVERLTEVVDWRKAVTKLLDDLDDVD